MGRVTGNLNTNLARIKDKIEEYFPHSEGAFKVRDMIRARVILNSSDSLVEAYHQVANIR